MARTNISHRIPQIIPDGNKADVLNGVYKHQTQTPPAPIIGVQNIPTIKHIKELKPSNYNTTQHARLIREKEEIPTSPIRVPVKRIINLEDPKVIQTRDVRVITMFADQIEIFTISNSKSTCKKQKNTKVPQSISLKDGIKKLRQKALGQDDNRMDVSISSRIVIPCKRKSITVDSYDGDHG